LNLMAQVRRVTTSEEVLKYLYEIITKTRKDNRLLVGASPRAAEHLLYASKALAFLRGRDYVIPDDIKEMAPYVLAHRLIVRADYEIEGVKSEDVIREILDEVEVPV